MKNQFQQYNHWRNDNERIQVKVPQTVESALQGKGDKTFATQDCTADPCSCTGCSQWD